ncbi:MAG: S8 family serine peptidase [Actinomycetota bacterium]
MSPRIVVRQRGADQVASLDEVVIIRNDEGFDPLLFRDVVKQTRQAAATNSATPAPKPAHQAATAQTATPQDQEAPTRRLVIALPTMRLPAALRIDNDRFLHVAIGVLSTMLVGTLGWSMRGGLESLLLRFTMPDQVAAPTQQAGVAGEGDLVSLYDDSLTAGTGRRGDDDGDGAASGPVDRTGTERVWSNQGLLGDPDTEGGPGVPRPGPSRIDWGDDLDHSVVSVDSLVASAAAVTPTVPSTQPEPLPTAPTEQVGPAGSREVQRRDGAIDLVDIPRQALALGIPTPAEQSLIDSLADPAVSPFIVIDRTGVIGEPNRRYVNTPQRLVDSGVLDDGTVQPGVASPPSVAAVTVDDAASEASLIAQLEQMPGVRRVVRVGPGLLEVISDSDATGLDGLPGVDRVDADLLLGYAGIARALPTSGVGSIAPQQHAAPTPARSPGSSPVVVAVIDSGFDLDNPELSQQWWSNIDEDCFNGNDDDGNGFVDDCRGWDFGRHDSGISPERRDPGRNHGNEVASIVAAARDGYGIAGVAPGATVMPLKVSRSNGTVAMSAVAAAIDYAVDNDADIVNISLITQPGVPRSSVLILEAAVARAERAGVMIVTGAGNDSRNLTLTPAWPASFAKAYDNVVTVGAGLGGNDAAPFSSDGEVVSYYAPGVSVATVAGSGEVVLRTGTSYAAPAVSGLLAVALHDRPGASVGELRAALDSASVEVAGRRHLLESTTRDTAVGSINLTDPEADPQADRAADGSMSPDNRYAGWRTGGW